MTIEQTRIKERRKNKKLTQNDMADQLGISQQAYQQLESGRTNDMRISTLKRICTILDTTSDYIIGLTNDPNIPPENQIDNCGGINMNESQNALSQLEYISKLDFSSYEEFLKIIATEGKYETIKKDLGMLPAYLIVCEKLNVEPRQETISQIESLED